MTTKPGGPGRFSLRRWSQRKLEAARAEAQTPTQASPLPADGAAAVQAPAATARHALGPAASTSVSTSSANADLPAIESLTIESDFAPFFKPQVDESIKRAALKQLFRDPRFNVMDGLDTYIGDYTQPDPIPAAMLDDLMQRRGFFPMPAAETDPDKRVVEEPAGDRAASPAEDIAPPVTPVTPVTPVAADDAVPDSAGAEPETGAGAKADKP